MENSEWNIFSTVANSAKNNKRTRSYGLLWKARGQIAKAVASVVRKLIKITRG